jgi:hypothetical protein
MSRERRINRKQADAVKSEGKECDYSRMGQVAVSAAVESFAPSRSREGYHDEDENGNAESTNGDAEIGNHVLPLLVIETAKVMLFGTPPNHMDRFAVKREALRGQENENGQRAQKNSAHSVLPREPEQRRDENQAEFHRHRFAGDNGRCEQPSTKDAERKKVEKKHVSHVSSAIVRMDYAKRVESGERAREPSHGVTQL